MWNEALLENVKPELGVVQSTSVCFVVLCLQTARLPLLHLLPNFCFQQPFARFLKTAVVQNETTRFGNVSFFGLEFPVDRKFAGGISGRPGTAGGISTQKKRGRVTGKQKHACTHGRPQPGSLPSVRFQFIPFRFTSLLT